MSCRFLVVLLNNSYLFKQLHFLDTVINVGHFKLCDFNFQQQQQKNNKEKPQNNAINNYQLRIDLKTS